MFAVKNRAEMPIIARDFHQNQSEVCEVYHWPIQQQSTDETLVSIACCSGWYEEMS